MKKLFLFIVLTALLLTSVLLFSCDIPADMSLNATTTSSITTTSTTSTTKKTTTTTTTKKEDVDNSVEDVEGSKGLVYELIDNVTGYKVVGMGDCKDAHLIIPDTYKGLPVAVIGMDAFNSNTEIISVVIPDSVTKIEPAAFKWCQNLESVTFEKNSRLMYIEGDAFGQCSSLKTISIPDSVTYIAGAFVDCASLETVHIGNSVKVIGRSAFSNCNSLKTMYYDGTVLEWTEIDIDNEWIVSTIPFSFILVCSDETRIISE